MHIHSGKRNRLDHKKLHDLVCIKYNQQLAQRYNIRDEIDPIVLNDIDECSEWLVGQVDDNDKKRGSELVFYDDFQILVRPLFMKLQVLVSQQFIQGEKQAIKESKHQVVVLLLHLPKLPKMEEVQLWPQHKGSAKRRFKLGLIMNWNFIALTLTQKILKNYYTLTKLSLKGKRTDMPHWITLKMMLGLKRCEMIRNLRY